ncbi:hypothetical protein NEOKW01_0289 [Nematocida sp. AWRm80]|nr:hypothetical protein NEOKW01_0289 [Nematocida sp. AWRm80]
MLFKKRMYLFQMLLMISTVCSYYIEDKYKENAVPVYRVDDQANRIHLCFELEDYTYASAIDLDRKQRFGKNAFSTYSSVQTKKSRRKHQSEVTEITDCLQDVQGWFIRERGTGMLSGMIFDNGKIIQIKPRSFIDPNSRKTDLIAFVSNDEVEEYVCGTEPQNMNASEGNQHIEDDYLERMEEYFQNNQKKKREITFQDRLLELIPDHIRGILFWWKPISINTQQTKDKVSQMLFTEEFIEPETREEKEEREQKEIRDREILRIRKETILRNRESCHDCTTKQAYKNRMNRQTALKNSAILEEKTKSKLEPEQESAPETEQDLKPAFDRVNSVSGLDSWDEQENRSNEHSANSNSSQSYSENSSQTDYLHNQQKGILDNQDLEISQILSLENTLYPGIKTNIPLIDIRKTFIRSSPKREVPNIFSEEDTKSDGDKRMPDTEEVNEKDKTDTLLIVNRSDIPHPEEYSKEGSLLDSAKLMITSQKIHEFKKESDTFVDNFSKSVLEYPEYLKPLQNTTKKTLQDTFNKENINPNPNTPNPKRPKHIEKKQNTKTFFDKVALTEVKDKLTGNKFITTGIPNSHKIPKKGKKAFLGIPFYSKILQIEDTIQSIKEYGFPIEKRAIPIAVAIDNQFIQKSGSRREAIFFVLETVNIASKIYERTFNILLYVNHIIIDKEAEWFNSNTDLLTKLHQFTSYRRHKKKDCLLYHLFTAAEATQKKIGLAWTGGIGYYSKKNVSTSVLMQNQFITLAHEIAHNIGLEHDCDEDYCKEATPVNYPCHPCKGCSCNGKYIMNRKGSPNLLTFSPSTQREMSIILSQLDEHLPKVENTTLPYPICGNGIVEKGEECDAGPFGDKCCTPDCKLRIGAVCSDANSACCLNCQPAPKGHVCRPSQNECHKPSLCDGISEKCPSAVFMPNRKKCSIGFCASGICTNKDQQCILAGDKKGIISAYPAHKGCTMKCINLHGNIVTLANRYFKDGTPCGWNGVCVGGKCEKDLGIAAMSLLSFLVGLVLLTAYLIS